MKNKTQFATFLFNDGIGGSSSNKPWWHGMALPGNEEAQDLIIRSISTKHEKPKTSLNLDMDAINEELEAHRKLVESGADRWAYYQ